MQGYATGFLLSALASSCFIAGVMPQFAKVSKFVTGVFAALFIVTEAMAVFGA